MDSDIQTVALTGIEGASEQAKNADKTAFFFDTTGNCATFYSYSGKLVDCAKMQVQKALGGITSEEIVEKYRKANVFAMKDGSSCVYNFDKIVPDLKGEYFSDTNIPSCIFKPSEMAKEDVYIKTVRDEENKDYLGNQGNFMQHKDYRVVVVS